jgi:MFS superfamily sulfate permease-like transporter
VLGRTEGMPGYHDTGFHETVEHLPGLVIYRFDAPLLFANAQTFRDQVRRLAATDPRPRCIVVAAEPITDVDTTAADMLEELHEALKESGTNLVFAELKDAVRRKMKRYDLADSIRPEHFYPTVRSAVEAYQAETGAKWTTGPSPYDLQ